MAEVDPVTGQPKVSPEKNEPAKEYDRLVARKGVADQLNSDIESERGQVMLIKIEQHLLGRINKLMDEDGECRALKKLLIDMGVTLNIGEVAVKNLMRMVTKK